jgi:hypothetical protein
MAFWSKKKRDCGLRTWDLPGEIGTVSLPADFLVEMEDDSTLLAYVKDEDVVTLRFSTISFQKKGSTEEDAARPYLKKRAAGDGLHYEEVEDKGVVSYEQRSEQDGVPLVIRYWEIASRNTIAILSATILADRIGDPVVKSTLEVIPAIVASIKITAIHKTLVGEDREVPVVEHVVEPQEQSIRPFADEEKGWLTANLEYAKLMGIKYGSGGKQAPEELDAIFARWMQEDDDKESGDTVANALGAAFGDYLVDQHGFCWVVVTDEYGTEYAVRHNIGQTMAFPRASVQKRIEDSISEVFQNLYLMITTHLRECESQEA